MTENWVKIFGNAHAYLVEIYKGLLEENEINAILLNKTDSMHLHLSNAEVELYVRKEDVMKAKHLIDNSRFE